MFKSKLFLLIILILLEGKSFSQGVVITQPKLEVDGDKLLISYDIITENPSDQFFIWLEIGKANGEKIHPRSLSGDIGSNIKPGNKKETIWAVNIVWVALVPNGYKPLQQAGISLNPVYSPFNMGMLLSLKLSSNF